MRKAIAEVPAAVTSRAVTTAAPASGMATAAAVAATSVSAAATPTAAARQRHARRAHTDGRHRAQRDHRFTQHVILLGDKPSTTSEYAFAPIPFLDLVMTASKCCIVRLTSARPACEAFSWRSD